MSCKFPQFFQYLFCEKNTGELGKTTEVAENAYTATFALPLAMRRFITLLPFAVFFLARKPWVFARLRFFGWYVTDMRAV